jgi:hypothetical protein
MFLWSCLHIFGGTDASEEAQGAKRNANMFIAKK